MACCAGCFISVCLPGAFNIIFFKLKILTGTGFYYLYWLTLLFILNTGLIITAVCSGLYMLRTIHPMNLI